MNISEFTRASVDHPDRCEDAIMVFSGGEGKAPVFAVIDGMGGHQRQASDGSLITGRDAALIVRETLIEDLQNLPADIDAAPDGEAHQRVIAALHRAHEGVRSHLNPDAETTLREHVGAVATVVVGCENGSRLLIAQVGDTRAYLFSEGDLIQLCYDEDNIEYLVNQGTISAEDGERIGTIINEYDGVNEPDLQGMVMINNNPYELYLAWRWFVVGNSALKIPAANIVINALGIHETLPVPQLSRMEIAQGEILFLCSDGVYKNLTATEMIEGLKSASDPATVIGEAAFARSQSATNRRSTQDDVSAVVAVW